MYIKNMKDKLIGELTVLQFSHMDWLGQAVWLCECNCGNMTKVKGGDLRNGHTKSCRNCHLDITNPVHHNAIRIRILKRVLKVYNGCWLWQRAILDDGYGSFNVTYETRVHRIAYMMWKGPIPTNTLVRHTCDVRSCCNPDHLILGTHKDNMCDMAARDRQAHGSSHPKAKLTPNDVLEIRKLIADGDKTSNIASKFNVERSVIGGINTGRVWKHIKPEDDFDFDEAVEEIFYGKAGNT